MRNTFFKDINIRLRLVLSVTVFSIIGICVILLAVGYVAARSAERKARTITLENLKTQRGEIQLLLEKQLYDARMLANFFERTIRNPATAIGRDEVSTFISAFIGVNDYAAGCFVRFEPNAFGGLDKAYADKPGYGPTGRFSSYWVREKSGKTVQLPLADYTTVNIEDPYQVPKVMTNPYYELPRKRLNESLIEPYVNPLIGKATPIVSISVPIFDAGFHFRGVTGVDVSLKHFQAILQKFPMGLFRNAVITLYSQNGTVVGSTNSGLLGKSIIHVSSDDELIDKVLIGEDFTMDTAQGTSGEKVFVYGSAIEIGRTESFWTLVVTIPKREVFVDVNRLIVLVITIGLLTTLLIVGGIWIISGAITRPIAQLTHVFRVVAGGNFEEPIDLSRKDELGSLARSFAFMRDEIRKQLFQLTESERQVRESEKRYKTLFESSGDAILILDGQRIVECNAKASEIFGCTCEEILGHRPDEFAPPIQPDGARSDEKAEETIRLTLQGRPQRFEWLIQKREGTPLYAEVSLTIITLRAGKHVQAIMHDVTERRKAQDEIRLLNEGLEKRVQQRTAELQAANKEMEAFAYSVSHDLRAPLRILNGFVQILREDHSEKLDEDAKHLIAVIVENTRKMDQLISDILALSRVTRSEENIILIDMNKMVQSVYNEVASAEIREKFHFSLGSLPKAMGDPNLMRQVWTNLLSNAIKYTVPREIQTIDVGGYLDKDTAVYFVRDSGVGFDPAYSHKLFGVFQRLHGADEFEGTGIGLAIVQRIVHRHGGQVWAEGKVNEGATFYFSLPRKEVTND